MDTWQSQHEDCFLKGSLTRFQLFIFCTPNLQQHMTQPAWSTQPWSRPRKPQQPPKALSQGYCSPRTRIWIQKTQLRDRRLVFYEFIWSKLTTYARGQDAKCSGILDLTVNGQWGGRCLAYIPKALPSCILGSPAAECTADLCYQVLLIVLPLTCNCTSLDNFWLCLVLTFF